MTGNLLTLMRDNLASSQSGKKELYRALSALGDETRFKIFNTLGTHQDLCVSDIAIILNISVAAASQHLSLLERRGLVFRTREGRRVYYKINDSNLIARTIAGTVV